MYQTTLKSHSFKNNREAKKKTEEETQNTFESIY